MKFWVKTQIVDKLIKSKIVETTKSPNRNNFGEIIRDICLEMDEPSPVIIDTHFKHFNEFNIVRFKREDFVESVDFEKMIIELVPEVK